MQVAGKVTGLAGKLGLHHLLYMLLGIVGIGALFHFNLVTTNNSTGAGPGAGTGAWNVVTGALSIESHLAGDRLLQFAQRGPTTLGMNDASGSSVSIDVKKMSGYLTQPDNVQCGTFVSASYFMADHAFQSTSPPFDISQAINYWNSFKFAVGSQHAGMETSSDGWQRIPAGMGYAPYPGDIMVWDDGGAGHVAIVVNVNPAQGTTSANVVVAQANSPAIDIGQGYSTFRTGTPQGNNWIPWLATPGIDLMEMNMTADYHVTTWHGYTVLGFLRSPYVVSYNTNSSGAAKKLVRINQWSDASQYGSVEGFDFPIDTWRYSSCSAASIAEVLNSYGNHYRIADILVTAYSHKPKWIDEGGLEDDSYVAAIVNALDQKYHMSFTTKWGDDRSGTQLSLDQIIATANAGNPVIVGWPPNVYDGGHVLVVIGGNAQNVYLADSSAHNTRSVPRTSVPSYFPNHSFSYLWSNKFYAIITPQH